MGACDGYSKWDSDQAKLIRSRILIITGLKFFGSSGVSERLNRMPNNRLVRS